MGIPHPTHYYVRVLSDRYRSTDPRSSFAPAPTTMSATAIIFSALQYKSNNCTSEVAYHCWLLYVYDIPHLSFRRFLSAPININQCCRLQNTPLICSSAKAISLEFWHFLRKKFKFRNLMSYVSSCQQRNKQAHAQNIYDASSTPNIF